MMKINKNIIHINSLISELLLSAKEQKNNVKRRLFDLRGNDIFVPSRGPIQPNGRKSIRFHFWEMAKIKHQKITDKITTLYSLIGRG